MKVKVLLFVFISQILFCPSAFSQAKGAQNVPVVTKLPSKEKRWALIIGVDVYQKDISPLYGTVNDAKALRDILIKSAGFTDERIILMTTDSTDADLIPTRGNLIDQLDKLQRVVPQDGLILFSFSGHGVSIGSDAFIIPSDGRIYQNADLMRERAIDVLRIKRAIQDAKVKQVIMFLDACRNDPVRAKGDVDNNLTTAYASGFSFETKNQDIEAYATLYATSVGDRAYEFEDRKTNKWRGYFSYAIEEGLKGSAANDKGEVTLAGLIRYIEDTVKERVRINLNEKQIPFPTTEGFKNSDLIIAVVEKNTPVTINPNSGEAAFWSVIESSNDIADFEEYIKRTSNGEFSGIYKATAELKIARLKKANAVAAWSRFHSTAKILHEYDYVSTFSEGLAVVKIGRKYGFIDKTGHEVIPLKYNGADSFSEGLAEVRIGEKYGFIDKTGREVVPPKYDDNRGDLGFSEGLARVRIGEKYGFVDKTGREVISLKYDDAGGFSEGLARVIIGGKYGFIDKTGRVVIPPKYDNTLGFSEGLAEVSIGGKYRFIDKTGREVVPDKYDYCWCLTFLKEGFIGVVLNGKKGFVDVYGNEYFDF